MATGLSMRDLQKISAGAIQSLPHAVPVKNGPDTVAVLLPVRGLTPEQITRIMDDLDSLHRGWSAEDRAVVDAILRDRGAEP